MRIVTKIISLALLLTTISMAAPVHAQQKVVPYNQRISTLVDVISETFDFSDYSEDFRPSVFNPFGGVYTTNNCNKRDRFTVLKAKDELIEDLLDNIMFYNQTDVDNKLKTYLKLDLELSILRHLDILAPAAVNEDAYEQYRDDLIEEMQKDFKDQYVKQYLGSSESDAKNLIESDTINILKKYEPKLNFKQPGQDNPTGVYAECGGAFSDIYDNWANTLKKFDKSKNRSIADFNKELNALISSIKNFPDKANENLSKVFKDETDFIGKATKKDDGFFKNLWNVTKAAGSAVVKDFDKVIKAFDKEASQLSQNTTRSAPKEVRELLLQRLNQDPTNEFIESAVQSGLDLNNLAITVSEAGSIEQSTTNKMLQIKKMQHLTNISEGYSQSMSAKVELSTQNSKLFTNSIESMPTNWQYVLDNQCK